MHVCVLKSSIQIWPSTFTFYWTLKFKSDFVFFFNLCCVFLRRAQIHFKYSRYIIHESNNLFDLAAFGQGMAHPLGSIPHAIAGLSSCLLDVGLVLPL